MGRSQGRNRNLAHGLINDNIALGSFNRDSGEIITRQLKEKITENIYDGTDRNAVYLDLASDLKETLLKISPSLLKKDTAMKKLIDFEVEEVFKESGVDLNNYQLGNLVESFLNDLASQEIPNLGRGLLNDPKIEKDLKDEIVNGYLKKLRELKNDRDKYFEFAINSYLPLGANENTNNLFNAFAQETVFYLIQEPVLPDALPNSGVPIEGSLTQERLSAAFALSEHIIKSYDRDFSKEDIYNQIALEQGQIITNYIFSDLSKEDGPLQTDLLIASYDDQGKIDYLNQAIKDSGDKNFSKEITIKINQLFGGKKDEASSKLGKALTGEEVFRLIKSESQRGALFQLENPGQKYNFSLKWRASVALLNMLPL